MLSENEINQLQKRKKDIHGEDRAEKQHKVGKMTAWERIQMLMDEDTFVETNMFLEHRCTYFGMQDKKKEGDGVITGFGKINGRLVCVYAQDFTVLGGSVSEMNAKKITDIQEKALELKVPIISLLDSGGARVQEGIQGLSGYGHVFYNNVKASGVIPQISAIMGTCAGGASYSPALTDFIVMVDKTSSMFITGPKVVKAAIGENVTLEELGGTNVHSKISGMVDYVAENEKECLLFIKRLLNYLPDNYKMQPMITKCHRYNKENQKMISNIIPESNRHSYDMKYLINCIVDEDSTLEIKQEYATNIITMLARIGGYSVGIVANQSAQKAGCIDINAADKAAAFIRVCDSFNIPLLNLVDVSGFYPGRIQEQNGIIRHGAKMLFAYAEAEVIKITVVVRKGYGGAYLAMCSKELGADVVYAWPNAEMAVMSAQAAVDVLYKNVDEEVKKKYLEDYQERFLNPYEAAHMGYVDEVIEPEETRDKVIKIISSFLNKNLYNKKGHKNIPL